MHQAETEEAVVYPHPYGARVLVTTEGLDSKPVLYIPDGAITRAGLERGIVVAVGEAEGVPTPPFEPGNVVQYHPNHGTQVAGSAQHLKLVNFDCIMAWEG